MASITRSETQAAEAVQGSTPFDSPAALLLADATPHIVWMAAPDGATTFFNVHGTDYTGCPRSTNSAGTG